jgi:hypothetical protein
MQGGNGSAGRHTGGPVGMGSEGPCRASEPIRGRAPSTAQPLGKV